jgi:hypothetical protein
MTDLKQRAGKLANKAGEVATQAAGSVAGAVAAPRTAATKLRTALLSPVAIGGSALLVAAYLAGRWARR